MQPELGREIGDTRALFAILTRGIGRPIPGRTVRRHVAIEVLQNRIISLQERGVAGYSFKTLGGDLGQLAYRIVIDSLPESGVEIGIECLCFDVPAPPQVVRQ